MIRASRFSINERSPDSATPRKHFPRLVFRIAGNQSGTTHSIQTHLAREQFKHKLAERLTEPGFPASKLKRRGSSNRTKIKCLAAGHRLIHEVHDHKLLALVVAAGKRKRKAVYSQADQR